MRYLLIRGSYNSFPTRAVNCGRYQLLSDVVSFKIKYFLVLNCFFVKHSSRFYVSRRLSEITQSILLHIYLIQVLVYSVTFHTV